MIKKISGAIFSVLLFSFLVSAQTNPIPNAGFEDWGGTPENPSKWGVINFSLVGLIDFVSATKSTDKYSGDYALQLESKLLSLPPPLPPLPITLPGAAAAGDSTTTINPITRVTTGGGFPFNGHPTVLKGYYKYAPAGSDTGSVDVILTKWNVDNNKRDTISRGTKYFMFTVSQYTRFTVLLSDYSETPDTAMIAIFSSPAQTPKDGTTMLIDELEFFPNTIAGIKNEGSSNENISPISLFPNPTSSSLTIETNNIPKGSTAKIMDVLGNELFKVSLSQQALILDVSRYENGLYLCLVSDSSGKIISTKKFSVNK